MADEKLVEFENKLEYIKWNILGLLEIRREDEEQMVLSSGLMVSKKHTKSISTIKSISDRVIYLIYKVNEQIHKELESATKLEKVAYKSINRKRNI